MENTSLEIQQSEIQELEIIPEEYSEVVLGSFFKEFFIEVSSVAMFTARFFKELFKPPVRN